VQREGLKGHRIWELLPLAPSAGSLGQKRKRRRVEAKAGATGEILQAVQQPAPRGDTVQPLPLPGPQMPSCSDSSHFILKATFLWLIDQ